MERDHPVVEVVNNCLSADLISQLSALVAQSPSVVEQALEQLVPFIVRTLAERAARPHGVEAIWDLTRQAQQTQVLAQLQALDIASWRGRGVLLLQGLLSDTYETTTYRMATKAGVPLASYTLLLEVAVAAVLGALGKQVTEANLDAASLSKWLQSQPRPEAAAPLLPSAASASASLPAASNGAATRPSPSSPIPKTPPKFTAGAGNWETVGGGSIFIPKRPLIPGLGQLQRWKWVLLLLPAAAIGYGVFHSDSSPASASISPATQTPAVAYPTASVDNAKATAAAGALPTTSRLTPGPYDSVTDPYGPKPEQPVTLQLSNGTTQQVRPNSTEHQLYRFLTDSSRHVKKNPAEGWINVDGVYFNPGLATLAVKSQPQLRNLAGILKTFPRTQILFGGYGDDGGTNLEDKLDLSDARAQSAMHALTELGVASSQLQAITYEDAYTLASNTTPAERARRQLSIKVISKSAPSSSRPLNGAAKSGSRALHAATGQASRLGATRRIKGSGEPRQRSKVGRWIKNMRQHLRSKRAQ